MDHVRFSRAAAAATAVLTVLLVLSLGLSACGSGGSAASGAGVQDGGSKDLAPSFSGPTLDGTQVSLEQYQGKPLILVYMTYT
jgi:cytochrome oxidase Cu insertion factor (SCO1/SenC/PrrC family)